MENTEFLCKTIVNLEYMSHQNRLFSSTFRFLIWIHFMYEMDDNGELCLVDISSKLVNGMKFSITNINNEVFLPRNDKKSKLRAFFFDLWSRNKKTDKKIQKKTLKENSGESFCSETVTNDELKNIFNLISLALNRIDKNTRLSKINFLNANMPYDRGLRFRKIKKKLLRSIINANGFSNKCLACFIYNKNYTLCGEPNINRQKYFVYKNSTHDSGASSEEEAGYEPKLLTNTRITDLKNSETILKKMVEIVFEKLDLHIFSNMTFENLTSQNNKILNGIDKKFVEKLDSDILVCYENEAMEDLTGVFNLLISKKDYCGIFLLSKIVSNLHRKTNYKKNKSIDEFLVKAKPEFTSFYHEIDNILPLSCSEHQFKINIKELKNHFDEIISNIWGTDLND